MYEDMIKRLRFAARWAEYGLVIPPSVCLEAADAIEELQKAVYFHKYNSEFWEDKYNSLADEKWIPVTEQLPEDGKFVLVCNDDGHMMIAKHETETYEWYYKYTNYDFDIWDNEEQGPVRYWMPLPEPPKEGEQ